MSRSRLFTKPATVKVVRVACSLDNRPTCEKSALLHISGFLAGEKPAECNTCWVKEDNGGQSRRTFTNRMYKEFDYDKAVQVTDVDGTTTQMPIYWDLRFGNLCNLKCVMCGPQSSSMWYKDWAKVHSTDHFYDSGTKINMSDGSKQNRKDRESDYDWWESEHFWEQLDTHKEQLQHVYLVGGEPMLVEPHYKFLQKLIDSDKG